MAAVVSSGSLTLACIAMTGPCRLTVPVVRNIINTATRASHVIMLVNPGRARGKVKCVGCY